MVGNVGSVAPNFNFPDVARRLGAGEFDRQKPVLHGSPNDIHAFCEHESALELAGGNAAVQKSCTRLVVLLAPNNELTVLHGNFQIIPGKPRNGQNDP